MELTGSITTDPGAIDGWQIAPQADDVSAEQVLSEYETASAFRVAGADGVPSWRAPREAASGRVVENIGDAPHVLAHSIQHGCTVVWFAKSSGGEADAKIGAVTPSDGIEIRLKNDCVWMMQLVGTDLVIYRKFGMDTLDISVMVVKL